jgi:predicted NAD/FAD-dependent oxidoreductase
MRVDPVDYLVIGAGISGLACAEALHKAGRSVVVLDKGRGFGGRLATRRMDGARIDHGAQYFTVRDERFRKYVDEWLAAGVIREWFRHLPIDSNPEGYPRYCGVNGMTDVPKYLARALTVHRSQQVVEVVKELGYWELHTQVGDRFEGRHLVVAAPLPQAMSILQTSGVNWARDDLPKLNKIAYEKGLAALVVLNGPSGIPDPGGMKVDSEVINWIGDNQQKGISPDVSAVTIHGTADFSAKHWDTPDSLRGQLMLDAAAPYLKSKVTNIACHRWGFTTPLNPWPEASYHNFEIALSLAGDAFGGPRVEGAFLSGLHAAETLLNKKCGMVSS